MRSKLFEEKPKTGKTSAERWVRVLPDNGDGYKHRAIHSKHVNDR